MHCSAPLRRKVGVRRFEHRPAPPAFFGYRCTSQCCSRSWCRGRYTSALRSASTRCTTSAAPFVPATRFTLPLESMAASAKAIKLAIAHQSTPSEMHSSLYRCSYAALLALDPDGGFESGAHMQALQPCGCQHRKCRCRSQLSKARTYAPACRPPSA